LFTRTRYQDGSLQLKERRKERIWEFRYYEAGPDGKRYRRSIVVGGQDRYPTESSARRSGAVQAILLKINAEHAGPAGETNFGAVLARYEEQEMPQRYSTRAAYKSYLDRHIKPRWADTPLGDIKPMAVEDWISALKLAPKTKSHIRSLMHTIFECAERWELVVKNPIKLVRVKGGTKRLRTPQVLTPKQFDELRRRLPEPYQTMILIAGCLGLRASEIAALQWGDFDFDAKSVLVQRSVVHGRVDAVKTEYSRDHLPLDDDVAKRLVSYKETCVPNLEGWLFSNPSTGRPYHQDGIQQSYIRPAGRVAGLGDHVGWHCLRHSYRSWLDECGAPISVQKELMRHASISTTMNVYGKVMPDTKRTANSKVVQLILGRGPVEEPRPTGGVASTGS
jgi:integrase